MRTPLPTPRRTEAALAALGGVVTCAVFAVMALGVEQNDTAPRGPAHAPDSWWEPTCWLAALIVGGVLTLGAIRRWAPRSNQVLFGLTAMLMGIGWVYVARIESRLASEQAVAVLVGLAAIVLTLVAARRLDWFLARPGTLGLVALALLGAGSSAGTTEVSAGAYAQPRQWLDLGSLLSVQPYGLAKIFVVVAAVGLTASAPRWLATSLIPHRHVVGASVATIGAWSLLIFGGDLASSVMVFAAAWLPLWLDGDDFVDSDIPTVARSGRARALNGVIATYAAGVGVLIAVYDRLSAQIRYWMNPWDEAPGATVVDAAFGISAGGISGVGPGLGAPYLLHEPHSDFVFAVIAEELGILGGAALLVAFTLLVGVGAAIAQRAHGVHRLVAAAAVAVIGLQAFFSIAGVLRLLPHTVGALPFVAYGPVAMIGNCIAVGLLFAVSDISSSSVFGSVVGPGLGSSRVDDGQRSTEPDVPHGVQQQLPLDDS